MKQSVERGHAVRTDGRERRIRRPSQHSGASPPDWVQRAFVDALEGILSYERARTRESSAARMR
jgi:hypothetical protein